MHWLLFALLAPAIYAVVTFIDKYLLSKEIRDYNAMPIYTALVGFIAGTIFWAVSGFPTLPLRDAAIVLATGILTGTSLVVYFRALSEEEASKINILFQMFPVVTLILSFLFLKESITLVQFIGFVIVLSSSVMIASDSGSKFKFSLSKAFFLILTYDIMWAAAGILMKFALATNTFSKVLCYESWGIGFGGIIIFILFPSIRKAFLASLKYVRLRALVVIGINEGVFVVAKSLTFFAFSLSPFAAFVSVLENTQALYAIIYGYVLTLLFPKIFDEDVSGRALGKKLIATVILLVGIVLIYK